MSTAYLGNRFEIHGGGGDLAFPHHESEIAQSEGATGERPFVEWWMHAGMLRYEDEKMSKSLGNLVLVRDLLRSYSGDAIRLYLVRHHYRDELSFHPADLEVATIDAARLRLACLVAEQIEPLAPAAADPATLSAPVRDHRERFLAAMDDDLDTPAAVPELLALASLALDGEDPSLKAEAGWMVRELGARDPGAAAGHRPEPARGRRGGPHVTDSGEPEADDLVPVSVRLGTVVPPEDPEDWTRPLTWVAAIGMLAAPAILVGWYLLVAPTDSVRPSGGDLRGGDRARCWRGSRRGYPAGTREGRDRHAGFRPAWQPCCIVVVGALTAGEVGYFGDMIWAVALATPNLAHAAAGALAGLAGCLPAALAEGLAARSLPRLWRGSLAAAIGALVTALVLPRLFGG